MQPARGRDLSSRWTVHAACQLSFSMVPAPRVPRRHLGCRPRVPRRHPGCRPRVPGGQLGCRPRVPRRQLGCRGAAAQVRAGGGSGARPPPRVPPRHPKLARLTARVPEYPRARLAAGGEPMAASGKRNLTQMMQQATSDASVWLEVHADDVQPAGPSRRRPSWPCPTGVAAAPASSAACSIPWMLVGARPKGRQAGGLAARIVPCSANAARFAPAQP